MVDPSTLLWPELQPGSILVAVSGGVDSVALLHLISRHPVAGRHPLRVAHVHHGLRGAAADADARQVRTLAASLNLPVVIEHVAVHREADRSGASIEMSARRLRHDALQRIAREHACVAIATGHTADDQIETLFLRLARGCGLRGAGGMRAVTGSHGAVPVIHPLLPFRHADLRAWLKARSIDWREDETNTDEHMLRNRARSRVVPAFESALGPHAVDATLRAMRLFREDDDLLESLAHEKMAGVQNPGGTLHPGRLLALPAPLRRRILTHHLFQAGINPAHVDLDAIQRIERLCEGSERGTRGVSIGGGGHVRRCNGSLRILTPASGTEAGTAPPILTPVTLPKHDARLGPFIVTRDGPAHTLAVSHGGPVLKPPRTSPLDRPLSASLSPRLAGRPLVVRPPLPGDRLSPAGTGITQKLSDIFINMKIPRDQRGDILLLARPDGGVVWLPGHAVDASAAVAPGETPLHITLSHTPESPGKKAPSP